MGFGKELRCVLNEKDMSVKKLADLTGIPATTLYSAICKDSDTVNMDYLKRICKALGSVYSTKLFKAMGLELSITLISFEITEEEKKLLDYFCNLGQKEKDLIMALIKTMEEQGK